MLAGPRDPGCGASTSFSLAERGHAVIGGRARLDAVNGQHHIRTDQGAQRTACAFGIGIDQLDRAVATGIEAVAGHDQDVLGAHTGTELAALAAVYIDDDRPSCHSCHLLGTASAHDLAWACEGLRRLATANAASMVKFQAATLMHYSEWHQTLGGSVAGSRRWNTASTRRPKARTTAATTI